MMTDIQKEPYHIATLNLSETPTFTDLSRWRLKVNHGAQTWHYLETNQQLKEWPQTNYDKYYLGLKFQSQTFERPRDPYTSARNGYEFYKHLQTEDGHWGGEYGGPMFLLPGLIITYYITSTPIREPFRLEIIRYLLNRAHPEDGGWGLHSEGVSTVFGTALNYVALRILGLGPDHPAMQRARATLHALGGATGAPAWGKFWLAALGVYEWEGVHSIPPELWSIPTAIPFHPSRWWVHCRMVYLPMGYIYGRRLSAPLTTFTQELRNELYVEPYESIDWPSQRDNICHVDLYLPHGKIVDGLFSILSWYESFGGFGWLRKHSLDLAIKYIQMEDENTSYHNLGPVNKALNWLVTYYAHGKESFQFNEHVKNIDEFMWLGPEGMMMCGSNGSQLWDTAFVAQAVIDSGLAEEPQNHKSVIEILNFLDEHQIKDNVPHKDSFRHICKGAWTFSTRSQSYMVSDCAAEGLKASLKTQGLSYTQNLISKERFQDCVDVLLSLQNTDGGYGSYEKTRGPKWVEWLNPAEVFANIMIEYSYTECTTAVLTSLNAFREIYPDYRSDEITVTVEKAIRYIRRTQRPDGSWFGAWAICFTYATMFALESLSSVGEYYENSEDVRRACEFLVSKQMSDGGWGESYKSCETGQYVNHEKSQVVNTAWALLALMSAHFPDEAVLIKGIRLIMSRQKSNGEWEQEGIEGVFGKNCMISYPNYKFAFTIWALGKFAKKYGNPVVM